MVLPDQSDVIRGAMVVMIVANQDEIGGRGIGWQTPGIDVDYRAIIVRRSIDAEARMPQPMYPIQHTTLLIFPCELTVLMYQKRA
jgi:hypothetical protein